MRQDIKTREECIEELTGMKAKPREIIEESRFDIRVGDVIKYNNKIYYLRDYIGGNTYIKEDSYEKDIKSPKNKSDPFDPFASKDKTETVVINSPDLYLSETYNVFICDLTFSTPQIHPSKKTFNSYLGKYLEEENELPSFHVDKPYSKAGNELQEDRFVYGSPMYAKSEY